MRIIHQSINVDKSVYDNHRIETCTLSGRRSKGGDWWAGIEVEIGEDRLKVWHSDSTLRTVIWLKKEEI